MPTRYQVRLKDQSGTLVAVITDASVISYTRRVNTPDTHELTLPADHVAVALFELDGQIEVWRRDIAAAPAIPWTLDYEGLHRTSIYATEASGRSRFHSHGRGYLDLVGRRAVLYSAGSAGANKAGAGETVIKAFVEENVGPSATAPSRLFAGVTTGFTVALSGGAGSSWTGGRAYRNVLDVIYEIAHATDVDYEVVSNGAAQFIFNARAVPLGTDRSATAVDPITGLNAAGNAPMIFSLGFGNMQQPSFSISRLEEVTAVIGLGQGEGATREVVEVLNVPALAESPWNRREITRQASGEATTAGVTSVAESALEEFQAREDFTFQVVQTPARLYGRDYFVGDLVTARYLTVERTLQLVEVSVMVQDGLERITIGLRSRGT